ncbi:NADH-quinone oxidoreductase subunit C [bacterium]|nr:NADH-quinone oxidoreductase subunit C [bacterium]
MEAKAIYELLAAKIGEAALGFDDAGPEPVAEIAPAAVADACAFLRDDVQTRMDMLMCLSGIDWDGYDDTGKGKSVAILGYTDLGEPETSERVADGDLGVAYHLYSHSLKHRFALRVRVPRDAATVPTVSHVWSTANWHEREAWDLLGIRFAGHPDLRRMLLDEAWVGHPLRKDYVMPADWEAVPMKGQPYAGSPFPEIELEKPQPPAGDNPPAEG